MAMSGNDISNVNGRGIIDRAMSADALIVKGTEGVGFKDPLCHVFADIWRPTGRPLGFYAFAHPANDPNQEADHFCGYVQPKTGERMFADFEPYGQTTDPAGWPAWLCTFLDRVNNNVGGNCGTYVNNDMGGRVLRNANPDQINRIHQSPLWKANYGGTPGDLLGWPVTVGWQSSDNTGIDVDTFFINADEWRAGGANAAPNTPVGPLTPVPGAPDLHAIARAVEGILNGPIDRLGGRSGGTSLAATVAWLDSNLDTLVSTSADAILKRELDYIDPTTRKPSDRKTSLTGEIPWMSTNELTK